MAQLLSIPNDKYSINALKQFRLYFLKYFFSFYFLVKCAALKKKRLVFTLSSLIIKVHFFFVEPPV